MNAKAIRMSLVEQIKLVREDAEAIPQAETIANLVGKTIKVFQLEMQAEAMREAGKKFDVIADILNK